MSAAFIHSASFPTGLPLLESGIVAVGPRTPHAFQDISALAYNTRLFGDTVNFNGAPTDLYFHDHDRVPEIANELLAWKPDIIGLTEVWDANLRDQLIGRLSERGYYYCHGSSGLGIQQIVADLRAGWPRMTPFLSQRVLALTRMFTQSHYGVGADRSWLNMLAGGLRSYLSEDDLITWIQSSLGLQRAWGSGLLLFSRYRILAYEFVPYKEKADLERFVDKGFLVALVQLPDDSLVLVELDHNQEGTSPQARTARTAQFAQKEERLRTASCPRIKMGDYNIEAGSAEYKRLIDPQGQDVFHVTNTGAPGYTFGRDNSYSKNQAIDQAHAQQASRIDYIMASDEFQVQSCRVLFDEFKCRHKGQWLYLSDHYPVLARLALNAQAASKSRAA